MKILPPRELFFTISTAFSSLDSGTTTIILYLSPKCGTKTSEPLCTRISGAVFSPLPLTLVIVKPPMPICLKPSLIDITSFSESIISNFSMYNELH